MGLTPVLGGLVSELDWPTVAPAKVRAGLGFAGREGRDIDARRGLGLGGDPEDPEDILLERRDRDIDERRDAML